jgi:Zn-dependent M28 family amino/carboxypeptidase
LTEGANVMMVCPGVDQSLPTFLISAHYDHLGMRGGHMYPGADDNASGVAVLIEIARRCRRTPFRHPTIFVAFDAEEQALRGSRAFMMTPPVPRDRLALVINLDMVARGDKGELYVSGTSHNPALRPMLNDVVARSRVTLLFGHDQPGTNSEDWTRLSDHWPFHSARVPYVYFSVEDHDDYHQPTDTAAKIDRVFFQHAAETILDAVLTLDRSLSPS